jgi:hypothetical protein
VNYRILEIIKWRAEKIKNKKYIFFILFYFLLEKNKIKNKLATKR